MVRPVTVRPQDVFPERGRWNTFVTSKAGERDDLVWITYRRLRTLLQNRRSQRCTFSFGDAEGGSGLCCFGTQMRLDGGADAVARAVMHARLWRALASARVRCN